MINKDSMDEFNQKLEELNSKYYDDVKELKEEFACKIKPSKLYTFTENVITTLYKKNYGYFKYKPTRFWRSENLKFICTFFIKLFEETYFNNCLEEERTQFIRIDSFNYNSEITKEHSQSVNVKLVIGSLSNLTSDDPHAQYSDAIIYISILVKKCIYNKINSRNYDG